MGDLSLYLAILFKLFIKTKVLLPLSGMGDLSQYLAILFKLFGLLASKDF